MKKVYLAGRISDNDLKGAIAWRSFSEAMLTRGELDPVNPLRGTIQMIGVLPKEFKYTKDLDLEYLFHRDLRDIDNSDLLLCNLDNVQDGAGSLFELGYAYAKNIPLYLCRGTQELRNHMFMRYSSAKVHEHLYDSLEYIIKTYGKKNFDAKGRKDVY